MLYKLVDEDSKNVSEILADELPNVGSAIKAWIRRVYPRGRTELDAHAELADGATCHTDRY